MKSRKFLEVYLRSVHVKESDLELSSSCSGRKKQILKVFEICSKKRETRERGEENFRESLEVHVRRSFEEINFQPKIHTKHEREKGRKSLEGHERRSFEDVNSQPKIRTKQ